MGQGNLPPEDGLAYPVPAPEEKRRKLIESAKAGRRRASRGESRVKAVYASLTNQVTLEAAWAPVKERGIDDARAKLPATDSPT